MSDPLNVVESIFIVFFLPKKPRTIVLKEDQITKFGFLNLASKLKYFLSFVYNTKQCFDLSSNKYAFFIFALLY